MRIAQELDASNAVPVNLVAGSSTVSGALTDRSGSITLGGTAQTLAAANTTRRYFFVHNISTGDLWVNFGVTAVADAPSIKLTPGASFVMEASFVSNETISIFGSTTGAKYVAKEGG